ncbi:MAG TPA: YkgJ family cysteine cluster protein [Isosphaeraceae bacterium]|nr:YkgJ family cysteine cluster protein [Isosphaeraceae bacterium]
MTRKTTESNRKTTKSKRTSTEPDRTSAKRPWFRDGLAFECTRCGACCTGAPGYVWVSPDEIETLAQFRGESTEQFSRRFVRRVGDHFSLIERPGGDCIFWDAKEGCTVYAARPVQCQTWPFWPENVESLESWAAIRRVCPGSGQGRLYTVEEIVESIGKVRR